MRPSCKPVKHAVHHCPAACARDKHAVCLVRGARVGGLHGHGRGRCQQGGQPLSAHPGCRRPQEGRLGRKSAHRRGVQVAWSARNGTHDSGCKGTHPAAGKQQHQDSRLAEPRTGRGTSCAAACFASWGRRPQKLCCRRLGRCQPRFLSALMPLQAWQERLLGGRHVAHWRLSCRECSRGRYGKRRRSMWAAVARGACWEAAQAALQTCEQSVFEHTSAACCEWWLSACD